MRAAQCKLRIREVPVSCRKRAGGVSKVSGSLSGSLRAALRITQTLLRVASTPDSLSLLTAYPTSREKPA